MDSRPAKRVGEKIYTVAQNDRERSVYIEGRRRAIGQDKVNIVSQPILSSSCSCCVCFLSFTRFSLRPSREIICEYLLQVLYISRYSVPSRVLGIRRYIKERRSSYPSTLCSFTIKWWRGAGVWAQDRLMASSNWIKSKWCITYGTIARRYIVHHCTWCLYRTRRDPSWRMTRWHDAHQSTGLYICGGIYIGSYASLIFAFVYTFWRACLYYTHSIVIECRVSIYYILCNVASVAIPRSSLKVSMAPRCINEPVGFNILRNNNSTLLLLMLG